MNLNTGKLGEDRAAAPSPRAQAAGVAGRSLASPRGGVACDAHGSYGGGVGPSSRGVRPSVATTPLHAAVSQGTAGGFLPSSARVLLPGPSSARHGGGQSGHGSPFTPLGMRHSGRRAAAVPGAGGQQQQQQSGHTPRRGGRAPLVRHAAAVTASSSGPSLRPRQQQQQQRLPRLRSRTSGRSSAVGGGMVGNKMAQPPSRYETSWEAERAWRARRRAEIRQMMGLPPPEPPGAQPPLAQGGRQAAGPGGQGGQHVLELRAVPPVAQQFPGRGRRLGDGRRHTRVAVMDGGGGGGS